MRLEILGDKTNAEKDDIFKDKLEEAKYIYLRLVYPFDSKIEELPNDRARHWQTACAIDLYINIGKGNLIQYSENGLTEIYSGNIISKRLLNDLPPAKAGVPK